MKTTEISKSFDFCYGHRVWNQSLNKEYSLDDACVCRHLHGHQGKLIVTLQLDSGGIGDNGMVTDFKHLNWLKKWIDDALDHKFIIDRRDPLLEYIIPSEVQIDIDCEDVFDKFLIEDKGDYWIFHSDCYLKKAWPHLRDILEGFVFVNFVPTSENLCNWLMGIIRRKMSKLTNIRAGFVFEVKVTKVEFQETPKSKCLIHA